MEFQNYEFSGSQNELIRDLSHKMRFVGYFLIALGALIVVGGIVAIAQGGLGSIISGVIQIIIGIWTSKAATSFQKIVDTQGNDIENLMGALGELRKLYVLQYWLYIVSLVFVALGVLLGVLSLLSGAGR